MYSLKDFKDKTVLVDCDNVLLDFTGSVLRYLDEAVGEDKNRRLDTWDITESFDEYEAYLVLAEWKQRRFWTDLQRIEYAREGIKLLKYVAKDVVVLTTPYPGVAEWHSIRIKQMKKLFGFEENEIIFATRKSMVRGDFLIDDRNKNVEMWKAANKEGTGILYEQDHNRGTFNWAQFVKENI